MAKRWYSVSVSRTSRRRSPSRSAPRPRSRACREDRRGPGSHRGSHRDAPRQEGPGRAALHAGYVLVHMEISDETYHLITSINRVTGFLGPQGKPMPMRTRGERDPEPGGGGRDAPRNLIRFEIGERVKVNDGPSRTSTAWSRASTRSISASRCRFDLRPGHPGRSGILSGDQDLLSGRPHSNWRGPWEGKGAAAPDRTTQLKGSGGAQFRGVGQGGSPRDEGEAHGQESHRVAEAAR
jgi:transcriptional antiterminator NusG